MNELLELQTGQVPFISGLMAGFSLSIAAQILRSRFTGAIAIASFVLFATSSLLFLIALYIDVGLTLRIAGMGGEPGELINRIGDLRSIGTSAATIALFLFIGSIGLMGWLHTRWSGILTSIVAVATFIIIWVARTMIFGQG